MFIKNAAALHYGSVAPRFKGNLTRQDKAAIIHATNDMFEKIKSTTTFNPAAFTQAVNGRLALSNTQFSQEDIFEVTGQHAKDVAQTVDPKYKLEFLLQGTSAGRVPAGMGRPLPERSSPGRETGGVDNPGNKASSHTIKGKERESTNSISTDIPSFIQEIDNFITLGKNQDRNTGRNETINRLATLMKQADIHEVDRLFHIHKQIADNSTRRSLPTVSLAEMGEQHSQDCQTNAVKSLYKKQYTCPHSGLKLAGHTLSKNYPRKFIDEQLNKIKQVVTQWAEAEKLTELRPSDFPMFDEEAY